jgi:SAM-dependent methyltransferase
LNENTLELRDEDWERLAAMRGSFLRQIGETAPLPDYWSSTRDLEIYDATFGARIRWKWNAVLEEIKRRGVEVPSGTILDFGAGTGVATRAFLAAFGTAGRGVRFMDRSRAAVAYAQEVTRGEHPDLDVEAPDPAAADVMLASHVLDELDDAGRAQFVAHAKAAKLLIWIESGAKSTSRALSAVRDALLDDLDPLLPCTHRSACGVLAAGRDGDWCHHFAPPAPEAFTTLFWRTFSRRLSIDMRALPYSYLVAQKRSAATQYDPDVVRVLGTPRFDKGRATLLACGSAGVREAVLLERLDKPRFKALEKGKGERRISISEDRGRITRIETR